MKITQFACASLLTLLLAWTCTSALAGEESVQEGVRSVRGYVNLQPATNPTGVIMSDGNTLTLDGTTYAGATGTLQLTFNNEKVKASYLGVETTPAGQTLRAQLKLPAGVGLAVKHVEGPAKEAGVQQHDVLVKINEQLLINTDQLAVLVRTFKPGEKIELTVIREAQTVKLNATLVEKEVESINFITDGNSTARPTTVTFPNNFQYTPPTPVQEMPAGK